MKLKYYLRGLGIGIIVTTVILAVSFSKKEIKIIKYKREVMRLQYATNKSFKKAKTITAKDGMITSIKKLKSKKTYYIRYADRDYADTDSGGKLVYTDWSNTLKVKTK